MKLLATLKVREDEDTGKALVDMVFTQHVEDPSMQLNVFGIAIKTLTDNLLKVGKREGLSVTQIAEIMEFHLSD